MEKTLVICPGRGTYNQTELGYFQRYHSDKAELLARIDAFRAERQQPLISALDGAERYNLREHSRGDNASALIWACAYADFLSIDRERFDICALTGNSMGWYIALGCSGALNEQGALEVINGMGTLMQQSLCGGQLIYPLVDEQWRPIPGRSEQLDALTAEINALPGCELYLSIRLGGLRLFGGNEAALEQLQQRLAPEQGRYPMRLFNHAAFHTPLQCGVAEQGRQQLPATLFRQPQQPLVDGRGYIWTPHASDNDQLWDYTLGHQVVEPYDFSRAVQVAVKEYAPERIIILGPGSTLGGAVAQSLIEIGWRGWRCKADFLQAQQDRPYLLSMGIEQQRQLVTG
ncbi:ACP S-malonyltransferase [Marinobacterium arenosum]|uniref:ACP S-malonyltransferase n=1 Tax=Marinobacterium arenosum TaxID=2862496 RepID=UPI001C94A9B8|nr:ACP S-malonyltransferase [Marinobacterium arenosum]MBY4678908.1 ACP S-malonyltransferase [Marinobacterium arenosum]